MRKRPPSQDDFEREMRSRRLNANPAPAPNQAPPQSRPLTRAALSDRDAYIRSGQQAWKRVKDDATYNDWLAIGEALEIGRADAMAEAKTNKPEGSRYNKLFGEWLVSYGFDDIDKAIRSKLFDILANRAEIDAWRATLPVSERLRYNAPSTIWRQWQASLRPKAASDAGKSARAKAQFGALKDANARIDQLTAHVAELEAARIEQQSEPIEAQVARVLDLIKKVQRKLRRRKPEQHHLDISLGGELQLMKATRPDGSIFFPQPFDLVALARELGVIAGEKDDTPPTSATATAFMWTTTDGGLTSEAQHGKGLYRVSKVLYLTLGGSGREPPPTYEAEFYRAPYPGDLSQDDRNRWRQENVVDLGRRFKTKALAMKRCEQDARTRQS